MASNMTLLQIYDNLELTEAQKQIFYTMVTQLEKSDDIVALAATSFKDVKEQIMNEKVCEKCKDPKCSCADKKDRKHKSLETNEEAEIRRKEVVRTTKMNYEKLKYYDKCIDDLRKNMPHKHIDDESNDYAYSILSSKFEELQAIKLSLLKAIRESAKPK